MRDLHTLGAPGRSGGVDHIGEVFRIDLLGGRRVHALDQRRIAIQRNDRSVDIQPVRAASGPDQNSAPGVGYNGRHPLFRPRSIQGQERASGFPDRQGRHDLIQGALKAKAGKEFWTKIQRAQIAGELSCSCVELAIGHLSALDSQGYSVRRSRRDQSRQLGDSGLEGQVGRPEIVPAELTDPWHDELLHRHDPSFLEEFAPVAFKCLEGRNCGVFSIVGRESFKILS